jgi:hypothetical protein
MIQFQSLQLSMYNIYMASVRNSNAQQIVPYFSVANAMTAV